LINKKYFKGVVSMLKKLQSIFGKSTSEDCCNIEIKEVTSDSNDCCGVKIEEVKEELAD
jgi:hypothetical protein